PSSPTRRASDPGTLQPPFPPERRFFCVRRGYSFSQKLYECTGRPETGAFLLELALRWARGGGRVFRLPLPTPSGLPTHPQRPGRSPGPKCGRSLRASGCKSSLLRVRGIAHRFFRTPSALRSDCVCAPFGRACTQPGKPKKE